MLGARRANRSPYKLTLTKRMSQQQLGFPQVPNTHCVGITALALVLLPVLLFHFKFAHEKSTTSNDNVRAHLIFSSNAKVKYGRGDEGATNEALTVTALVAESDNLLDGNKSQFMARKMKVRNRLPSVEPSTTSQELGLGLVKAAIAHGLQLKGQTTKNVLVATAHTENQKEPVQRWIGEPSLKEIASGPSRQIQAGEEDDWRM
jgi:hypothetical protein